MAEAVINLIDDDDDEVILVEEKVSSKENQISHSDDKMTRVNNENFETMECPICLQICVHPSKLPCGHIFCFLCVKGLKNLRCAMCRTDFPMEFLERPDLLMPVCAATSSSATEQNDYQWFYRGRNGGWWQYDARTNDEIEMAFLHKKNYLEVQLCGSVYGIDLNENVQYCKDTPNRKRDIKRWWQYDPRTCQEIEEAYKKGDKHCTILVAGYVYIVDFEQMLQQRQNDPSRKRQVKRDLASIPIKGVAGLRLPSSHSQSLDDDDSSANSRGNCNLIATIAATDAAIRIASDIIDSTLAHADEYQTEANSASTVIDDNTTNIILNQNTSATRRRSDDVTTPDSASNSSGRRELLDEIEETLNITNPSSINNSIRSTGTNIEDFFSITLDDFRNLTLSNIADDSSDDSDVEHDDSGDNIDNQFEPSGI